MISQSILRALQIYGIAIVISMLVAVLIKVMVKLTGQVDRPRAATAVSPKTPQSAPLPVISPEVPADVVAAITAALAVITGPHRILHISESKRSWARQGRDAQHSHQPSRH